MVAQQGYMEDGMPWKAPLLGGVSRAIAARIAPWVMFVLAVSVNIVGFTLGSDVIKSIGSLAAALTGLLWVMRFERRRSSENR